MHRGELAAHFRHLGNEGSWAGASTPGPADLDTDLWRRPE